MLGRFNKSDSSKFIVQRLLFTSANPVPPQLLMQLSVRALTYRHARQETSGKLVQP